MRWLLAALALLLVAAGAAMAWQHARYLRARRTLAQDRQALLHPADALHVVLFLERPAGAGLFGRVQALRLALEEAGGARTVYAGKVALNAIASAQLAGTFGEEPSWDAVLLVQLPSRAAWERAADDARVRRARAGFARTYAHGMRRWRGVSLALPQLLLALRVHQILTRAPSHEPFEPAEGGSRAVDTARLDRLAAERALGGRAVMVVNLVRRGSPAQQAADRAYTRRMLGLMAERGHGPLHLGEAVPLERDARFDRVAIVYYPGVDDFAAMARSRFYQGIVGDKQLGDTQAVVTVPILERLDRL